MKRMYEYVKTASNRAVVSVQLALSSRDEPKASTGRHKGVGVAGGLVGLTMLPVVANAATTGGTMPWDGPLQTIVNNLTGPVATAVAVGAFFVAGAILVFGEDMSAFVRRLLMAVIAVSLLVFGTQILSDLGITNGAIV